MTFCSMYFDGIETQFNRPDRNQERVDSQEVQKLSVLQNLGHPFGKKDIVILEPAIKKRAEWYVMNNYPEIWKYLE